tara:strand:- start:105 stop:341 length:237 start_codon:yes stop_codon:yes gene_type:complete
MKFIDIDNEATVSPGEYVLHVPTKSIVLCGAFIREENMMKVLGQGSYFTDSIDKFKKIEVNKKHISPTLYARCKGCGA